MVNKIKRNEEIKAVVEGIMYIFIIWCFVALISFLDFGLIKGAILFTLGLFSVSLFRFIRLIVIERRSD